MTHTRTLFFTLCIVLFAISIGIGAYLWGGGSSLSLKGNNNISAKALSQLQNLSLADLTGKPQAIAQWQGKIQVINFWATWCPPCRKEMPGFSRLQSKLAAQGVQFIGIGLDSPMAIKEYAMQYPVLYPLLAGGTEGMALIKELGNSNAALPYTLVLNAQGEAVFSRLGMIDEDTLEKMLLPQLDKIRSIK